MPHYVSPALVQVLVNFLGQDVLDDAAHDTLSALLSLLKTPITIAHRHGEEKPALDLNPEQSESQQCLIEQQLWAQLRALPSTYFMSSSSKVFRTWFQWVCRAEANGIALEEVYDPLYWSRLQRGLLNGFGEQRKYCLGILRHSLLVTRGNITTPLMTFEFDRRSTYQYQYEKYCTLFEIIVLNRYQNQVQACLPELTTLLGRGSLISSGWQTTLLSAALSSKIQDGLRKMIGSWYIDYVTQEHGSIVDHASFFIDGFLPWATQGSLFTSSLISSRQTMTCVHGADLVNLLARFIVSLPTATDRRKLFTDVLHFVLEKGGRIFQHAIVYLLEGLLDAFKKGPSFDELEIVDLEVLLRVSRLTGLPEIASELCVTYCAEICDATFSQSSVQQQLPGYDILQTKFKTLKSCTTYGMKGVNGQSESQLSSGGPSSLPEFLQNLHDTQHKSLLGDAFVSACADIDKILNQGKLRGTQYNELCGVLEALWDEAERQDFRRPIVVQLPPLFFHQACIRLCVEHESPKTEADDGSPLTNILTIAMQQLYKLAERRSYLSSVLATSLRKACLYTPQIMSILPFEEFLVQFIEHPPIAKVEFLFEVAAAEKLQQYLPHRDFASFYGKREWYAYAAVIDLLNRFPDSQLYIAERVMHRLLEPWANQNPPIPIISKWKSSFQLQAMLLLAESCVSTSNAESYLESFTKALMVESWPRYRYLLEWIIARIYFRCPSHAPRMLETLANLDEGSPIQVASLMKLAVLVAPFLNSEEFTLNLMTQLVPFSSHHKVQIRHEAHWTIPIVWDLATEKGWESVTSNPAFRALNKFVTSLERFSLPSSSIRTLKLDAMSDYTVTNIFQGHYLAIEAPERELFTYADMHDLWTEDKDTSMQFPVGRVSLGDPKPDRVIPVLESAPPAADTDTLVDILPTTFQTKSGIDLDSLLPIAGPPSAMSKRPASVILVASLIDNPTNLGGLSRISESFGLESLYISDIRQTSHKEFKATSVTSEKHLQIHELKVADVPAKLVEWKRSGWTVVGVEQTDRSGILGTEAAIAQNDTDEQSRGARVKGKSSDGTLPRRCILVLGSEKGGISSEVLASVDRCVEIKTTGVTRSLNVQTAGGIAVYEWWREWGGQL
ncbi:hypothetical protein K505DRAFT_4898 [Melanomma pulvis-pyrius CBS 109.77]|uniref:tRNA/rRNA methyltransferase SpoU type domain-containing protein n=1 Tax=Melanomma pulvis-pyrius CBS 109.77 TaxID=1314802 RepID=A0A6A6XHX1_9PLEO|nr:hypothetical protein K505DRAFT_4898 [Melanomma pulvis-pyrius CBS 109.77]